MHRTRRFTHLLGPLGIAAGIAALLLVSSRPAHTDDRDLLRFGTASPYLMILLDTSASMALTAGDSPVPTSGYGDHPLSRLYTAKSAMYEVFLDVTDVNFGFVSFNNNQARVFQKHWLYYTTDTLPAIFTTVGWPKAAASGATPSILVNDTTEGGTPYSVIEYDSTFTGSMIAFGPHFKTSTGSVTTAQTASGGYIDLATTRGQAQVNAFPKAEGNTNATTLWVKGTDGRNYQVTVRVPGDAGKIGDLTFTGQVTVLDVAAGITSEPHTVVFRRDPSFDEVIIVDRIPPQNENRPEETQRLWDFQLATSDASCGTARPFHGQAWEGNYDSGVLAASQGVIDAEHDANMEAEGVDADGNPIDFDRFEFASAIGPIEIIAIKPADETVYSTKGRALDYGDFIPWDWNDSRRDELLCRLAPNLVNSSGNCDPLSAVPDFGIASYFADQKTDSSTADSTYPQYSQYFKLKSASKTPLMAIGDTALSKVTTDLRCWYMGTAEERSNNAKCKDSAFADDFAGWRNLACDTTNGDSDWGCRKPYIVVISDASGDSGACHVQNATASLNELDQFAAVNTWAINLGKETNCSSGSILHSMTQTSDAGECFNVSTKEGVMDALEDILGRIREETRAFAAAAVPTVQATAEQSIYVSNFTPLDGQSRWDGHLNAFLKPLPVDEFGRPATTVKCEEAGGEEESGCFLWDVAESMLKDQYYDGLASTPPASDFSDFLSLTDPGRRRVFYAMDSDRGYWADNTQLLLVPTAPADGQEATIEEKDLWDAFGISYTDGDTPEALASQASARSTAETVIRGALQHKEEIVDRIEEDPDTRTREAIPAFDMPAWCELTAAEQATFPASDFEKICYLLGDIFHSNPVVVGPPVNLRYFAENLGSALNPDGAECEANDDGDATSSVDRGYRCFFARHKLRRRVIAQGHNDGMLHVFNLGIYDPSTTFFTNGTGHELFAYMPRSVMPTVRKIATGTEHHYTVDDTPAIADVFIDPVFDGSGSDPLLSDAPEEDERRWRTVLVSGLREGGYDGNVGATGRALFALDMTQPDKLVLTGSEFLAAGTADDAIQYLPTCYEDSYDSASCGPVRYGSALWEFRDSSDDSISSIPPAAPVLMDEDDNGHADLGYTWSTPNVGRLRICDGGNVAAGECNPASPDSKVVDKYVAVFGGGLDPDSKDAPRFGRHVYIVDVETGKVLYKRQLLGSEGACHSDGQAAEQAESNTCTVGAVAAPPAAVDTDQDGYYDRIYVATTLGYLYRIDVAADADGNFPNLADTLVNTLDDQQFPAQRIPEGSWDPLLIFDANYDGATALTDNLRPIYYRPSVFFIGKLGLYGIALVTGEREDLWQLDGLEGRLYVFADDTHLLADPAASLPYTEDQFVAIPFDDNTVAFGGTDFFVTFGVGARGWYLELPEHERAITPAFSLFGVMFFSSYKPLSIAISDPNCDPLVQSCEEVEIACDSNETGFCSKTGTSRLFVVNATNGDGLLAGAVEGETTRYRNVAQFVTQPFTEPGQTKNPESDTSRTADELQPWEIDLMETLKGLYPDDCKFTNYRIDVKTIAADTTVERIAAVPICIIEKNWKEY
ncbi:MAG TPA: hypothetical protein VMT16_04875 [Thermoanaerobaculia bacterium]|nr:hypothetical protein [Thermoanaerobaculia bacterium]